MAHREPLAERLRPTHREQLFGQAHLLADGAPLAIALEENCPHSMILWGPPGTGKTTLARMFSHQGGRLFQTLSAVQAGVREIRKLLETAAKIPGLAPILFIDEIHRFNKAQQDSLLPGIEQGTVVLIGATTENPAFELNNALLSRCQIYVLKRLDEAALGALIKRAWQHSSTAHPLSDTLQQALAGLADGDGRRAINLTEQLLSLHQASPQADQPPTPDTLHTLLGSRQTRFDKGGDHFYEQISALHKSIRGSAPDATLYWLARMLDGGCDPLYLARRLVRIASEDIGNADPRALPLSLAAWDTLHRLGSPEGELALAHCASYLACAPKSNAVYQAWKQACKAAKRASSLPVPDHLCNADSQLMQQLGKSQGYRYPHDEPHAYAAGVDYFPQNYPGMRHFYQPTERGLEGKIAAKLQRLQDWDQRPDHNRP